MTMRLCVEAALAGCLALGASIWGVQSTSPAILAPADDVQSVVTVPFPLATVEYPEGYIPSNNRAEPFDRTSGEAVAQLAEIDIQPPSLFHRAGLGNRIPDARNASSLTGHAVEVASNLPTHEEGT